MPHVTTVVYSDSPDFLAANVKWSDFIIGKRVNFEIDFSFPDEIFEGESKIEATAC